MGVETCKRFGVLPIVLCWLIMLVLQLLNSLVFNYGISSFLAVHPRSFSNYMLGVFFSEFCHWSWSHFISNSFSFMLLSSLVIFAHGAKKFFTLSVFLIIFGNLLLWGCSWNGNTAVVGASG